MRLIGIDFGTKKLGVAVGQMVTNTANPLPKILLKQGENWSAIHAVLEEWQPDKIIVGIPYNMDDSEMTTTPEAIAFIAALQERFPNYPVDTVDERLTTKEAKQQIFENKGYAGLRQVDIDSVAACLILEQWMENHES